MRTEVGYSAKEFSDMMKPPGCVTPPIRLGTRPGPFGSVGVLILVVVAVDPARTVLVDVALMGVADIDNRIAL